MGDTAPDGAAVAHCAVGNPARNASQHPARKIGDTTILDIGVGDAGADRQRVGCFLDLRQLGDAGQIDQHIGLCEPKVEHGAERLAAGDEFHH